MDHLSRSIPIPIFHHATLSKRDFESDTWLILGLTAIVFAVLSSLGIFILCYRRRGHKRRMDRKRMMAAKTRGDYAQLEEAKGDTEDEGVPLEDRAAVAEGPRRDVESPRITPPPPPPAAEPRSLTTSSPPTGNDRGRISPPQSQPQPHIEPQLGYVDVNLQHPQPHGVYLPPLPSIGHERSLSLSPEYTYEHNYDEEYDVHTGDRFDSNRIRSRSPSLDLKLNPNSNPYPNPNRGLSVLSRSASMLRPR